MQDLATVVIERETLQRLKAAKRSGQTYDELLRAMMDQYNPTDASRSPEKIATDGMLPVGRVETRTKKRVVTWRV